VAGIPNIHFSGEPGLDYYSNRWLSTVLIKEEGGGPLSDRETVRVALEKENIEIRPLWKLMYLQPIFGGVPFYGDGTSEKLFERGLCLPSGSNLREEELGRVVKAIKQSFGV
jgi:dTDP-4-amino-4,6-dideoxygalactose transaminase